MEPQQRRVAWLTITLLSSIGLQIINPQILGYFIDTAVTGGSEQALFAAALLFITVALVTQALVVVAHCLRLDLSFHKARTPGELIERVDGHFYVWQIKRKGGQKAFVGSFSMEFLFTNKSFSMLSQFLCLFRCPQLLRFLPPALCSHFQLERFLMPLLGDLLLENYHFVLLNERLDRQF